MRLVTKAPWFSLLIIWLAVALACNSLTAPATPSERQPLPTETKQPSLPEPATPEPDVVTPASPDQAPNEVRLVWSEADLTHFIETSILPEFSKRGFDITDPQVRLRDGKMTVTGKYKVGLFTIEPRVVMTASVQNGRPVVKAESADFGPVPVPQELLDELTTSINDSLREQLPPDVVVTEVTIADGKLTVAGRRAP